MQRHTLRITALSSALLAGATLMALRPAPTPATPGPEARTATDGKLDSGSFEVDGGHSSVIFSIVHQGVSPNYGRFNKVGGVFEIGDSMESSFVMIEIDAASVDTNSEKRDDHLRSPDFFNTKQFPKIVFESTSIKSKGGDMYAVTGDLTFHGVTKEITIDMKHVGSGEKPQAGFLAGFGGEFTIDRKDFGITTYPGALGDEVRVLLGIEGRRK